METRDANDRKAGKNVGPKDIDETEVTFGPYSNDLFTEILLDKSSYIKNCFYYMLKKGNFPHVASMDYTETNHWVQDLSQIVKTRICELIVDEVYVEKTKQKSYVYTIIWRKCDAENERRGKNISINAL